MVLWTAILLVSLGVGASEPTSTTTTIPASPAAGLALKPMPPAPAEMVPPRLPPGRVAPTPVAPGPGAASALAAMVAGFAVLASRARRISGAEQTIRESLQDSLFSDVDHADLTTIAQTVAGLDPGEATAVVGSLSDDELGVWIRELDGWRGGFDPAEQARLFTILAGRLSSGQLARLITQGKSTELMAAVGTRAPAAVRVQLALLLWGDRDPSDRGWGQIIELVEGAPGDLVETAVAAESLPTLAVGLLGIHQIQPGGASRLRLDAMVRFLQVAARFQDPHLKAQLFLTVSEQLRSSRRLHPVGRVTREDVLGRLAGLLRSDTSAVVTQLNHAADPHGNLLSQWMQDMIEADRFDELDVLFSDLIGPGDRLAFFSHPGLDPARPYPNAANLGYYTGAYSLAIDGIADDAEEQINLVAQLFAIVTGLVPDPGGSEVRLPFSPLVDVHAEAVVEGFRAQATSLKQTLWGLAKPRTPDGLLWNGAGIAQFQDAWEEVVEVR